MNEAAASGGVLALISLALLAVGLVTNRLPLNEHLDTSRGTAPGVFWALMVFWVLIGLAGITIMLRNYTS